MSFTGLAQSPPVTLRCSASATPPIVSDRGVSELASEVLLTCQGVIAPSVMGQLINVRAYLNTNVTSRLLSTSPDLSEALLLVDDPAPMAQRPCPSPCMAPASGQYNVFQAKQIAGNVVEWILPLESWKTLRITNVRANINLFGDGPRGVPIQLVMFVMVRGNLVSTVIDQAQQTVGFIQSPLNFTSTSAILTSSQNHNTASAAADFTITYAEGFASAFKTRTVSTQPGDDSASAAQNIVGKLYGTTSGFYNPSFSGTYLSAGLATQGTRLIAHFQNIPRGVELLVSALPSLASPGLRAVMVSTGPHGEGSYRPISGSDFIPITVYNGSALAVWEIVAANADVIERIQFDVAVRFTADSPNKLPEDGIATVRGSLGPLSTYDFASLTDATPRFAESSQAPIAFTISGRGSPVVTFVVNAADFSVTPLAPGSIAAVLGTSLTFTAQISPQTQLPLSLGGTAVKINGIAAPIYATTPSQVNIRIPWELAGVSSASLTIMVGNLESKPLQIRLNDVAPHIFTMPDGSGLIAHQFPFDPGSRISIYLLRAGVRAQPTRDGDCSTGLQQFRRGRRLRAD